MTTAQYSQGKLITVVFLRIFIFFCALLTMFFLPAGTWTYWEAWVYLAIVFIPMLLALTYFIIKAPEILERRMRMREKESGQKLITKLFFLYFLLIFLLPGFDKRFGWSSSTSEMVIMADILVLVGYGIILLVVRENQYASRIIEVEQGHQIITHGPYALVRHPMYAGALLLYIFSPLALGSYWAMIPALLIIPLLVARIRNEESVLVRDLQGYEEYLQTTKYRLIPGLW
jgi:protein-S-isoprenylcysteine O-methyltransferase Ste14